MEKEINPPVDIDYFGDYRLGLTAEEIDEYLRRRTGKKNLKKIRSDFDKTAGVNTCAIGPQGQTLMYRHDVKRFADVVLLNKPTYFD